MLYDIRNILCPDSNFVNNIICLWISKIIIAFFLFKMNSNGHFSS